MTAMVTPVMAVIQVGFMAALAAVAAVVLRKSNALSRSIQVRLDRINRVVREAVTGVRVIRAFNKERREEARIRRTFEQYAESSIQANRLFVGLDSTAFFMINLCIVAILWIGGNRIGAGYMEIGDITALIEYYYGADGYHPAAQGAGLPAQDGGGSVQETGDPRRGDPPAAGPGTGGRGGGV